MSTANVNLMKQINLNVLRRVLKEQKRATQPQLAKLTGLSVVTIHSLVETLLERGEILADPLEESSGGRPAALYSYNENYSLALILYTREWEGRDLFHAAVVNLFGEVIDSCENVLQEISETSFDGLIQQMLEKFPNIKSIGIGMPGQEIKGRMESSDYQLLNGKAFPTHIRELFQVPVIFENDVNAAVLGYCTSHQCCDKNVVAVYIPEKYPLGAGIFINGEVYRGSNGFVGEAQFLPDGMVWGNPAHVSQNLPEALKKLIVTFTCLLNPDRLVFYRENLTQAALLPVLAEVEKTIKADFIPEVIVSARFGEDFENGIKQLALNALDTQWK